MENASKENIHLDALIVGILESDKELKDSEGMDLKGIVWSVQKHLGESSPKEEDIIAMVQLLTRKLLVLKGVGDLYAAQDLAAMARHYGISKDIESIAPII